MRTGSYAVSVKTLRITRAIAEDALPDAGENRDVALLDWSIELLSFLTYWRGIRHFKESAQRIIDFNRNPERKKRLTFLVNAIVEDLTLKTRYRRSKKADSYFKFQKELREFWGTQQSDKKRAESVIRYIEQLENEIVEN